MTERSVMIPTDDGVCDATLHVPDDEGSGPWPAVIMFVDAAGVRPTFKAMADRLAAFGYAVLLPNVYYRSGNYEPFETATVFTDQDERARMMALMASISAAQVMADTRAMLDHLAEQPEADTSTVGTTGYCMGGRLSLNAAGHFPERIAAAASFHGGRLVTDASDSPHLLAGGIRATVYVAGAEHDASFDADQAALLEFALSEAGVSHTIVTYQGAHGFAVPDNPTYDEAAAERHWQALDELYGATLTVG